MLDIYGIQNGGIYGIAGAIGIIIILWLIFRNFGSGRIGMERQEVAQDNELLDIDKKALAAAREQRRDAGILLDLIISLDKRLGQIGFSRTPELEGEYKFIIKNLKLISAEGKGAIQDRKSLSNINRGINVYCSNLPNEASVNSLVIRIKNSQIKLFRSIANQIGYYRARYALLRRKADETRVEAGVDERVA